MSEEALFRTLLEQAGSLAKNNCNQIEKEQIEEIFAQLALSEEQLLLVYEYLVKQGIKINGYTPSKVGPSSSIAAETVIDKEASGHRTEQEDAELQTDSEDTESELSADSIYMQMYLEELKATGQYSAAEKREIVADALRGDRDAKQALVTIYLQQVVDIARLYIGQGVTLEDLIGEGNIGLIAAVEMIQCCESNEEIPEFIGRIIMEAMGAAISEQADAEEFDKQVLEKMCRIHEKGKELSEDLMRKITIEELALELGTDIQEVKEAIRLFGGGLEYIE